MINPIEWIKRRQHAQGYGIQSPWAYNFVRNVVCERLPYYGYKDVESVLSPSIDKRLIKRGRLYFRIANYLQATSWMMYNLSDCQLANYVRAGSLHTTLYQCDDNKPHEFHIETKYDVTVIGERLSHKEAQLQFCMENNGESIIIIEGINKYAHLQQLWKKVLQHPQATVAFDLYYEGIIFCNTTKNKQLYKLIY